MEDQKSTGGILNFEGPNMSIGHFIDVSVRHYGTLLSLCT
jgi:hypothetical protein